MRRAVTAFLLAVAATIPLASAVSAIGPGGWDHTGVGASSATPALNGTVTALNTDDPGQLIVGGSFTSAGGKAVGRIALWSGGVWSALAGTQIANGTVFAIAYHAGKIYAGGTFLNAGGNANADFLAVWDGAGWAPFCNPVAPGRAFGGSVKALQIIGNKLYVGGAFQNGAGLAAADYLVACDLTTGAPSALVASDGDINGGVEALAADSNGVLYAGGQFINLAGIPDADHVAAYHGTWHAMGSGPSLAGGAVDGYVRALAAHGTDIYVGTDSVNVAGIANADHVAKWNGSSWSALGSNTGGTDGWLPATASINALAVNGRTVFAAGSFLNANGVATGDDIAYFDGTSWRPIGSNGAGNGPMIANLTALAVFRTKVYVGGNFTSAGGDVLAQYLAAYALQLPDARIALASAGPWTGNAVYSPTGVGESRTSFVSRSKTVSFYVNIQNDGLTAAAFTIKGYGSARGYSVRYYRGSTNITTAVKAGTYSTGAIGPRSSMTVRVLVSRGSLSASSVTYYVRASSVAGTPADAVRAIAKAH